jgi:hypothetical protein
MRDEKVGKRDGSFTVCQFLVSPISTPLGIMASPKESISTASGEFQPLSSIEAVPFKPDARTVDGKPLYVQVTILEPEITEKDGEKFMVYPLSTEVCSHLILRAI